MKFNIKTKVILLYIPDITVIAYILAHIFTSNNFILSIPDFVFYLIILLLIIKNIFIYLIHKHLYTNKIKDFLQILKDFKKGRFLIPKKEYKGNDRLANLYNEFSVIGKYIDTTISTLKDEINILRELYNNIVLSISSYLIILNNNKEVIYVNDVFCKKFQQELEDLIGKNIDDIFLFVSDILKNSIDSVLNSEESIILEKTHLLSKNWISVIADIKITNMTVQGDDQIILIIDDITSKCRKDYQINLISQVTGSIKRDEEIHKILYTILYGITSGAGLGFNRAMLFLLDNKEKYLTGEIAVGPDSIEEAIEIWNSMPVEGIDTKNLVNTLDTPERKGTKLLKKVISAEFDIDQNNVFTKAIKNQNDIHIYDSWNDASVDDYIRTFMDVKEFVVVPLIVENKSIGIIVADNKYNQVPIGQEHIELLKIFAVQASLLIESFYNVSTLKKEMDKIKNRQEAMIESEKLAAIGRISSHIAHEIRNPLVTMGGYARRIKQISGEDDEKIEHAADVILKESIRLENILSNVMDLTKPQSLIKSLNNINEIITDTIDLLKNVFLEKRIRITVNLYNSLPLVNSDANQIKQVILNLLQNAVDATPEHGEIEVLTGIDFPNDSIFIKVLDTGTGIKNENLDTIFEPFFTTKITGVGLGLPIVHRIIKDHNGDINVKNRSAGGAEFTIYLPSAEQ